MGIHDCGLDCEQDRDVSFSAQSQILASSWNKLLTMSRGRRMQPPAPRAGAAAAPAAT